ncbi:hypothetical protein HanXRQr2_Chr16g0755701 [Helianthus annuus]|uniref:Uncharacterized protein n=1 Tax=Helianthus annuus TaxID=4232 RepID=A0A9K3DUQ4_HELAN|nr:hypothetical protein HanXRQr2_Chr16g0755701 [Helianthus annuus]
MKQINPKAKLYQCPDSRFVTYSAWTGLYTGAKTKQKQQPRNNQVPVLTTPTSTNQPTNRR